MKTMFRVLSILVLAAMLAACGGQASPAAPAAAPQAPEEPAAAQQAPPAEAGEPTQAVQPAAEARPLMIIASDSPASADPAENWSFGGAAYLPNVYETLFRFVGESNPKMEPQLATELPTVENSGISSDGLVYTIKLNPAAKFHDGSPVNADAVIYSFERMKALKLGVDGISANAIDKMEKLDEATVKFTLVKPFSDFKNALSSVWGAYIVNPTVVKAHETKKDDGSSDWGNAWLKEHDAGSGPYVMSSFDTANNTITLERNKEYWGGWTNSKPVEKVIIRWLAEATGARPMLEKGDVDIVINPPANDFDALGKTSGIVAKKFPSIMQFYIALNGSAKPLNDVRVRQALAHSFDVDKVISDIFLGNLVKMEAAVGPGYPDVYPAKTQYPYDLEKAKALLKEAGLENGFELTVNSIGAMPNDTAVLEFWQADLAKIGVTLKIQQVDYGTFDQGWFKCNAATAPNLGQASALGVGGDYPSAWEVLAQVYPTPRLSGDKCSVVYLDSPKLNETFNKITQSTDPTERQTLFQSLYDTIADEAGAIWVGQGMDLVTMRDTVQGYEYYFSRGGNYIPLDKISLK
jgi:peptide/nickel transport system substrate-binding protein